MQAFDSIAEGAVHFHQYLTPSEQQALAARVLAVADNGPGFYTPIVRGGKPMSVRMLCLGRHWNAHEYKYERIRSDVDQAAAPALPDDLAALARRVAADAGLDVTPDICIVNWYSANSKMGLHQDKDESDESLSRGCPVVSISLGDRAKFLFGGLRRRDPVHAIWLDSGDAFVFGGASRLCYHGVARILPGTAPAFFGFDGRLNLTFRQF